MNKPHTTCFMISTIDGKSVGKYIEMEGYLSQLEEYGTIHSKLNKKATIIGRITFEEMVPEQFYSELAENLVKPISRDDFIADYSSEKIAVAIDPLGKLLWKTNEFSIGNAWKNEHIVEVLTEQVSDAFLSHLQKIGVSYVFAGKEALDLPLAMEKLKEKFQVNDAMLVGGAVLNGSFLKHGLIDDFSLYLVPVVDGGANVQTIVEVMPKYGEVLPVNFKLKSVESLNYGVHLLYEKSND